MIQFLIGICVGFAVTILLMGRDVLILAERIVILEELVRNMARLSVDQAKIVLENLFPMEKPSEPVIVDTNDTQVH